MIFGTISLIVSLVLFFLILLLPWLRFAFSKLSWPLKFGVPQASIWGNRLCGLSPWAVYFPRVPGFTYTPMASKASASVLAFLHIAWIHPSMTPTAFHVSGNELMMPFGSEYHPLCHHPLSHFAQSSRGWALRLHGPQVRIIATYQHDLGQVT